MKKLKRFTAGVIATAMALSLMPAFALTASAVNFDGGNGTNGNPYLISTAEQLDAVRNKLSSNYKLTADIDLSEICGEESGRSWTPIGNNSDRFKGTFDGDGHKITGLYINSAENKQGLFGYVGGNGKIQNLGVDGTVTVTGTSGTSSGGTIGGIVGYNYGAITDCYNNSNVTGNYAVGGIAGQNDGTITKCYNTGNIKATGTNSSRGDSYAGGIAGGNNYNITNCYNTGAVTGSYGKVGGITGEHNGKIENCYNTGAVTVVSSSTYVGSIVGNLYNGTVTNCYYLEGCVSNGTSLGTSKTAAEFNSGEVAYLLQNGQADKNTQVWGQKLTDTKDNYPVLSDNTAKKVYRVTFKYTNKDEYAYANPDGTVTVPAAGAGYTWAYNEEEFTSGTPVTADMTVTAVKKSLTAEIQGDIVTSNGTGIYKDDIASGFAALITSNLKTSISKIAVTAYEHDYTTENLPELTIDSGSGIVIGIIIPGITITSASDITFNIE